MAPGITSIQERCPSYPKLRSPPACSTAAARGAEVESALAPGVNALKTFDPPLSAVEGRRSTRVGRRGKMLTIELDGLVLLST